MSSPVANDARLSFRLPSELKTLIEEAAAALGQSVSDYAVSTLVGHSRNVLQQTQITKLSNRDRDLFIALLDDADAKPNKALSDAAKQYNEEIG